MHPPHPDREIGLLFAALRACAREAPLRALRERLLRPFDGDRLVDLAWRQEVHLLLSRGLQRAGLAGGEPWFSKLEAACQRSLARNMFLRHELDRVVRILDEAGVPCLTLKGPILAERLYGSPDLRTSGDLDLCVRGPDVDAAVRALRGAGYRLSLPLDRRDVPRFLPFDKSLDLVSTSGPVTVFVDLHWDLAAGEHMIRVDLDGVWRRADPAARHNGAPPGLSPEDTLLFLALHGFNHGWSNLKQVCDVDAFIRRHGAGLDWTAAAGRAREWTMADILERALRLSRALLETPLPAPSAPCLENGYWREDPLASAQTFVAESSRRGRPGSAATRWLTRFRNRRGAAHRARHVVGSFQPRSMDYLALPEGGKSPWLARLVRPFRVAGKVAGEVLGAQRPRGRPR